MTNPEHLEILRQGAKVWNKWRNEHVSVRPILSGANLDGVDISSANLDNADISRATFRMAKAKSASFIEADFYKADLSGSLLTEANLMRADLGETKLLKTNLSRASLGGINFGKADLTSADLSLADLRGANFFRANLTGADLSGANLMGAQLVDSILKGATLSGSRVYGVAAWKVEVDSHTKQQDLVISDEKEPRVTVDNIEVAQFVHLVAHNEKIRDVIDTIGRKGVLLLGRFTDGRFEVLARLREALRQHGYLPIVFNFDKPEIKDFTETVRLLAGMAKFVIADLTSPKSAPYELGSLVSQTMIPFQPIIDASEKPFAMLRDLLIEFPDRVFRPISYSSVDRLIETMEEKIIKPAEERFRKLVLRRTRTMRVRRA